MIRNKIAGAVIASLITVLAGAASRSTPFSDMNLWTYDFLMNHRPEARPSSAVVVADFDDASFARIHQFPIPRNKLAELIDRISKARPKIIGLDFLLSEERTADQDQVMRQALVRAGNVVLASQAGSGGIPGVEPLPKFCLQSSAAHGDCEQGAFGFAFVNLPVDADGFIRRVLLFSPDEHHSESFALQLAELYSGTALTPASPKAARFGNHLIPYAETDLHSVLIGSWGTPPVSNISADDILDGKVPDDEFRGKIVLIGQSSDAGRDREFTPVFRRPTAGPRTRLSGTQVHAAGIETLLSGTALRPIGYSSVIAFSFLVCAVAVALLLSYEPRYSVSACLLLIAGCYILAQGLFNLRQTWVPFLMPQACVALAVPAMLGYRFVQEQFLKSKALMDREQMMSLFSRYVDREVAAQIWQRRDEIVLAGEEKVATVLFSDIRSFTALTAGKPSRIVLSWLNEYLTAMDEVISEEKGFLNKFIGDGLMILFGVPLSLGTEDDTLRAFRCAIRMHERVHELNRLHSADADFPPLKIGVGMHTGLLTCGSVGSHKRLEYSVIGETVNLASRLESLTKDFKTQIVLSESTFELLRERVSGFRELGSTHVRGFEQPINLFAFDVEAYNVNVGLPAGASDQR